jgi:hypothetical protein
MYDQNKLIKCILWKLKHWNLEEKAVDEPEWRPRFGRDYEGVVGWNTL